MKIFRCSSLALLAFLAVMGLGLAFTSPAEARWERHRNYHSEYHNPVNGQGCGQKFWSKDYRNDGRYRSSCGYYDHNNRQRYQGYRGQQGHHWR